MLVVEGGGQMQGIMDMLAVERGWGRHVLER